MTSGGIVIRIPVGGIRKTGRSAQGVRLIALRGDDRVVTVERVPPEERSAPGEAPPPLPVDDEPDEDEAAGEDLPPEDLPPEEDLPEDDADDVREDLGEDVGDEPDAEGGEEDFE